SKSTMPSSNPGVQPTGPFIPGVFLLAALATAVYQAIKLYPPLLLIFSFFILLIGANIQTIPNRSEGIPSGTYIILLSIACVLVGLVCDKYTKSTWESCFFHFVLSHFVLMWFEQNRFSRLRRKVQEEEKAQSKHDPEKEASQTPEGDPHA
ncbi:hypothetical protein K469DRAFT_595171, partial [Zopfia rhizophila CBS 207.26]